MENASRTLSILVFSLLTIVFSCSKKSDPAPNNPVNPVTSNPVVTGIPGAIVSTDAAGKVYTITVPAGTDVTALKLDIPIAAGATISPNPSSAHDYTNPVNYTITTSDGKSQSITVAIVVQAGTKSSEKKITDFSFLALNPVVHAVVDETTHKIIATVTSETDLTKLVPAIVLSSKATVSPASGVVQNFSNTVNYTVTAEDGSKQIYEVKIEKTSVGSDKPCLLTRIEDAKDSKKFAAFDYDVNGRISRTTIVNAKGETYYSDFGYDQDGNLTLWTPGSNTPNDQYDYKYAFIYTNGKLTDFKYLDGDEVVGTGKISDLMTLDEKGRVTSIWIYKLQYTGENVTKFDFLDVDTHEVKTTINIEYDNKNHWFLSCKPKGITGFFYWSSSSFDNTIIDFGSVSNNPNKISSTAVNAKVEYVYNKSGFPIKANWTGPDTPANSQYIFTYSNCQ